MKSATPPARGQSGSFGILTIEGCDRNLGKQSTNGLGEVLNCRVRLVAGEHEVRAESRVFTSVNLEERRMIAGRSDCVSISSIQLVEKKEEICLKEGIGELWLPYVLCLFC
jgi:hypothetical protein